MGPHDHGSFSVVTSGDGRRAAQYGYQYIDREWRPPTLFVYDIASGRKTGTPIVLSESPDDINFAIALFLGVNMLSKELDRTLRVLQRLAVLAGLDLDGQEIPRVGSHVFRAFRPAGQVTSGAASPRDGKPIALALLTLPHPPLGTRVEVDSGGTRLVARTRALPFLR
jgi:hypothetical protein